MFAVQTWIVSQCALQWESKKVNIREEEFKRKPR